MTLKKTAYISLLFYLTVAKRADPRLEKNFQLQLYPSNKKLTGNTMTMTTKLHVPALLLGTRDFFNNQTRRRVPACTTIRVSISSTVSNVDSHTDFPLVNVATVAFYCPGPVVVFATISDPEYGVNRQWTAALGAIEGDEPSLTAVAATSHPDVALKCNAKSCVALVFSKLTILQEQKQHEKQ